MTRLNVKNCSNTDLQSVILGSAVPTPLKKAAMRALHRIRPIIAVIESVMSHFTRACKIKMNELKQYELPCYGIITTY